MNSWILTCPNCQQPLSTEDNKRWQCAHGHSFDRAKQGYLNLLAVQHKRSRQPGDSAEMVAARQRLLDSGLYRPIAEQLNAALQHRSDIQQLADIGCGEGYYTAGMAAHLSSAQLYGIDISKDAVRAAAKRSQQVCWLVASGAKLPLETGQLDVITCLFTRLMPEQFAQALKQNGEVITLSTGEQHLLELRQRLYKDVCPSGFDPQRLMASYFDVLEHVPIRYTTCVPQARLQDLIMMTPHYWRTTDEARQAVIDGGDLEVQIDVNLHRFRRLAQSEPTHEA
ncbi:rRNA (guanine-N1)-methyltransferase [Bacterioplanes sanyensis]|uniref:rRNA (Guanine-N1)-methyltransferase n=1 Tax=Bacterioplanes sanyensis TaxID=1249553 RepID=A0A222FM67_9GAMM|nr:methyltransferase domain-containing protein [Bacterioplanes sanyensis]ASP40117.1 rRNA (guanine-N1)-methyltransferase [Bacterioplanes sanyensis]